MGHLLIIAPKQEEQSVHPIVPARRWVQAYDRLIKDQHVVATSLKALADAMRSYRGLPIAPHDEGTLTDQRSLAVFDSFIRAEEGVLALLQRSVDEHRIMRGRMRAE